MLSSRSPSVTLEGTVNVPGMSNSSIEFPRLGDNGASSKVNSLFLEEDFLEFFVDVDFFFDFFDFFLDLVGTGASNKSSIISSSNSSVILDDTTDFVDNGANGAILSNVEVGYMKAKCQYQ